jgi:RNA polymerase sigma-70 factor (ECF subfamily)
MQRSGRRNVDKYFTNYAKLTGWHVVPSRLDGREVLAVYRCEENVRPHHVVVLTTEGGQVKDIRDYGHVDYLVADARF